METVSHDYFAQLDIRVAKVISVERIPGKTRIFQGRIEIAGDVRTAVIGGAQYYEPDSLVGRVVVALANLEPRMVAGVKSEAMLLTAVVDDKPFWVSVPEGVPTGSQVR